MFWKLRIWNRLLSMEADLKTLLAREMKMSQVVDDLVTEVKALRGVVDSADALLTKLFALIQGGIDTGDVVKVQAALDDLKAQQAALAQAVAVNTPPTVPPAPPAPAP